MSSPQGARARGLAHQACAAWCLTWSLTLAACVSEPTVPTVAAEAAPAARRVAASAARGADVEAALSRQVAVSGPGGRLTRAQRQALLERLAAQGSASLLQRQLAAMAVFGDVDLLTGNSAQLLVDGPATFAAMFKAIDAAQHSVLVESYIIDDTAIAQRLAEALIKKRAQGLQVAMIYDAIGSLGTDADYFATLRQAGVAVCAFNPLTSDRPRTAQAPTQRDHRKILTTDRQLAFVGGINISGVYASGSFSGRARPAPSGADTAGWRDTQVQLRGPVAARLDDLVRQTWTDQGCEDALPASTQALPPAAGRDVVRLVATEPGDADSRVYTQLMTAFDTAQRSIHVTMAYFAPGDDLVASLCDAARRGVDVQLVLPSHSDFKPVLHAGRARYAEMLDAGVRIHEFQNAVLHAKTVVVDGVWSTVGSSNFDYRSFVGNNEVNVVVLGEDFGDAMQRMFRRDLAASRPITAAQWRERPLSDRLLQEAARLFERWW